MSALAGKNAPRWLRAAIAPYRRSAAAAVLLGIATLACASLLMFASGYLISKTALPSTTLFAIMVAVALVQVFGIGRPLLRYLERLVSHDWVFRVTSSLRLTLFGAVESQAGMPGGKLATGRYLELLSDDIGHLQDLYLRVAFPTVVGVALIACSVAFAGFFSPAVALAVFACGALAAVLVPFAALNLGAPLLRKAKALRSDEYALLGDDILGAADWALARRCQDAIAGHGAAGRLVLEADASARKVTRAADMAARIASGCGLVAIVVAAACTLRGDAESVNYVAALVLGFFPVIESMSLLPGAVSDFTRHADSIGRLDGVVEGARSGPDAGRAPRARGSVPARWSVELDGVSYRYPGSAADALSSVSLAIPHGQKVAVLGRSGAGKTTLSALVRGDIGPASGTVAVAGDGAAGRSVCYVPQTAFVFDQTLRDNLLIAKPGASDGELARALERVGLGEKLNSLADGLDAHVGETGSGLSGGEAQRLSLARALLTESPVVVLDEPFAALDPATERGVRATLLEAFADRTLIVITHHLSGIMMFDRVVFLEGGRVKLDGSPRDLAHDEPEFRELLAFDGGLREASR